MTDSLGALFANAGRRFHGNVAIVSQGRQRTFGEVVDRGWRLAHALRDRGVRPGQSVAAMLGNRVESLEVYVGLALGGFTAVHVNDRLTAAEVDYVLSDSGAVALVHTDGASPVAAALTTTAALAAWLAIDDAPPAGAESFDAALGAAAADPIEADVRPEDIALVGYTSGTTGFPKGVLVSHRAVTNCIKLVPYAYRFPLQGHAAFPGGWSFVSGLWGVIFPHFYTGGTVSFIPGATPDEWGRHMVENRSTFTLGLTPLIPGLMEALRLHPGALDTLQSVLHSGGPLPPELASDLVELIDDRLVETYGMTEVVGPITITNRSDWRGLGGARDIFASVGRPLPTSTMRVANPDGETVPDGEVGELVIEADTMFSGYHNQPEKTAAALRGDEYFTGDLGFRDEAGYFYLTGRAQDLIISGGANVYPAEVERVLVQMDEIVDASVFGLPDERWGEAVSAAVVLRTGAEVSADDVRAFARTQLAGYKKPVHVFFLAELPRNSGMKVMKHVLKEQLAGAVGTDTTEVMA
ncbi:class I adenylate-forming enzyme family protein [Nocardioides soli]|uniref:Acyl-CoA synthetase (AMP-forming)/AMP-acid ligase II n=1 Tax=Nocardioides soli TaxID=1036020 RepID=A0A7W4VWJ0_9ACTN|nr:AMP-binding protein [Nocardioides soli]MBB3042689.1 acyl-CoA synthetase (AMP-forming)/AMP-acid ligase II [Nocardioides soli]